MVSYYPVLVLTYTPTLILMDPFGMGTSTATSHVITRFKQMPRVVLGSDMSHLMEIIIHMTIFEFCTQKPVGDHAWSTKVIIELYHIA